MEPIHATAIAWNGFGCLLLGGSGAGKSSLAAEAVMMGAKLIGDDRISLSQQSGMLIAAPVPNLAGVLELHGLGLIRLNDTLARHVIHLAVELDHNCSERLPEPQSREFGGVAIPYLCVQAYPKTSAAALMLYMKAMQDSRILPPDWRPGA